MRIVPFLLILLLIFSLSSNFSFGQDDNQADDIIRLGLVGDIFLGNWAEAFIDSFGVDYPFNACRELFDQMDLVVGNFESPILENGEPYLEKQYLLKSPPGIEKGLFNANIRAVTLANNHVLDYGPDGLQNTIKYLDHSGVKHFGAGSNRKNARKEAVVEIKNQKVAFLGFSATFPEEFWATDSTAGTAFPYNEDVRKAVTHCNDNYDVVVVVFHWGAEKMTEPKDYQRDLAHLCIDLGADLVVGHHPHVVQGIEFYRNVPVFYSLGNFAFASYSENAKIGLIADINFQGGKVISSRAVPVNVYNAEVNFQPTPLSLKDQMKFNKYLEELSIKLNTTSITIDKDGRVRVK